MLRVKSNKENQLQLKLKSFLGRFHVFIRVKKKEDSQVWVTTSVLYEGVESRWDNIKYDCCPMHVWVSSFLVSFSYGFNCRKHQTGIRLATFGYRQYLWEEKYSIYKILSLRNCSILRWLSDEYFQSYLLKKQNCRHKQRSSLIFNEKMKKRVKVFELLNSKDLMMNSHQGAVEVED